MTLAEGMRKVQSQLLIPESTRDRVDAISLVIPDTRAEVVRRLIESALPDFERIYEEHMASKLDPIAKSLGLSRMELAARMKKQCLSVADWDPATGRFRDA